MQMLVRLMNGSKDYGWALTLDDEGKICLAQDSLKVLHQKNQHAVLYDACLIVVGLHRCECVWGPISSALSPCTTYHYSVHAVKQGDLARNGLKLVRREQSRVRKQERCRVLEQGHHKNVADKRLT